jgi:HK97 family phage portal protein
MNLFRKIFKRNSGGIVPLGSNLARGFGLTGPQAALNLSTVYRCVDILGNSVAQLPVIPFNTAGGNKRVMREHPTYRLLTSSPNRRMTVFMFLKMMIGYMLLRGNAYAWIERDTNNNPVNLHYIPADFVAVNEPVNLFADITYTVAGLDRAVEHTDMIHILNFPDQSGIRGVSTIYHAAKSLGLTLEIENNTRKRLNVSGILSIESALSDKQIKDVKTSWMANESDDSITVLSGGWRYIPVVPSAVDSQLLQMREFHSVDVARWFGVPTTKLGINQGVSYNGIEGENIAFLSDTLQPLLQKIECELERKLYKECEQPYIDVKFDISSLLRVDLRSRAEYYRTLFNIGALTINEIRNDMDYGPIEHGDKTYIQVNMTTLDNLQTIKDKDDV